MGRSGDPIVALLVAGLFYLFVWRNPQFQNWFSRVTQKGGGGTTTTTTTKANVCRPTASGGFTAGCQITSTCKALQGGGFSGDCHPPETKKTTTSPGSVTTGGATTTGSNIYPRTSGTCSCSSGSQTIGCSGKNSPSLRVNCNNCKLQNYEATAIIQFGGGCGCGDEATIKHYGPTHSDGNCCWAISTVQQDGRTFFGGEGPHQSNGTNKTAQALGSVGNIQNKKVGIKSVIWKTAGGAHQELFVDPSGAGTS